MIRILHIYIVKVNSIGSEMCPATTEIWTHNIVMPLTSNTEIGRSRNRAKSPFINSNDHQLVCSRPSYTYITYCLFHDMIPSPIINKPKSICYFPTGLVENEAHIFHHDRPVGIWQGVLTGATSFLPPQPVNWQQIVATLSMFGQIDDDGLWHVLMLAFCTFHHQGLP